MFKYSLFRFPSSTFTHHLYINMYFECLLSNKLLPFYGFITIFMILITEIINLKIEDGKTEVVFKFHPIKIKC